MKLDLSSKYNYPKEIQTSLKEIIEILKGEEVLSIIALGSLPRGELSYRFKDGKLEMFSDIELLFITERKIEKEKEIFLIKRLKDLSRKLQPGNPLFNIAIEFMSLKHFKKLPFKVRFYELNEVGETLFGEEIRYMIPRFDSRKLNMEDTNSIILRRLISILLYLPKEIFKDGKKAFYHDIFKYVIARNALDIATVLLFQKGIFIPTYRKRIENIVSNSHSFISDFDSDFSNFLTRCLGIKLDMNFEHSLLNLFENTLKYLKLLLFHTLKLYGVDGGAEKGLYLLIKKSKSDIFGEKDITKMKFKFLSKSPNLNILQRRLGALSYSFLGCLIFFLLNINESAYLYLKNDRNHLSTLDNAWWVLIRLGLLTGEEPLPIDFINRFLYLRKIFFYELYIKFMLPETAEYTKEILNWEYE